MANTKRSDARSVDVVLSTPATHGVPHLDEGWHGIAQTTGIIGDTIALDLDGEYEVNIGAVAAVKGAVLYLSAAGVVTAVGTDRPFIKVTVAKDAANYVWGKLLPQTA